MTRAFLTFLFIFLFTSPLFADFADTAWVRRYNGPGNSQDIAIAIAVDDSGNAYVTGQSLGNGTGWDYATLKYYPDGETAWVRRYNGPIDSSDVATALAIDGTGNVYVTGYSQISSSDFDYVTLKYYPDGETAWVRRYNGPESPDDRASDIAVDDSGNVYVTGYSFSSVNNKDYATVKYDINGNELWVKRYNGSGNGGDGANAIAVDNFGNIYVTGGSNGGVTIADYATLKYDLEGNELWVRRYNGPKGGSDVAYALALDSSGNVYVTGGSAGIETLNEYATVKYDSSGNELWIRRYCGEPGNDPGASTLAIAADGWGNAWVTGWTRMSNTLFDYATVKYDQEGNKLWAARYHSWLDGCDVAYALAVDGFGNVYVTGSSDDADLKADDFATVKYDPGGNQFWVARYNGPVNSQETARAITVDDSGNVYVTGESQGTGTSSDYTTIKYLQLDALRGDANSDGSVTVSDVVYMINYLFKGGPAPVQLPSADLNCDSKVTVSDVVYLINYLFKGGPKPAC